MRGFISLGVVLSLAKMRRRNRDRMSWNKQDVGRRRKADMFTNWAGGGWLPIQRDDLAQAMKRTQSVLHERQLCLEFGREYHRHMSYTRAPLQQL